jgi:hypothetical protein
MLDAELRLDAPRELSIWVCRPEAPELAKAPPPPAGWVDGRAPPLPAPAPPSPPPGWVEARAPPPPIEPAPPAPRSPGREALLFLPTELLTWPGCLLDFQALLPLWPAPPPRLTLPVLMLPVLMLVLRLTLMLLLPPPYP